MLTPEIDADLRLLETSWNQHRWLLRRVPIYPVSTDVNSFLISVAKESLLYREEEWQAELGAGLFTSSSTLNQSREQIIGLVERSAEMVLNDAYEIAAGRSAQDMTHFSRDEPPIHILLIDVLEAIKLRWCNIWPFCRPTPGS